MPRRKNWKDWMKIKRWEELKNQTVEQSGAEQRLRNWENLLPAIETELKQDKKLVFQLFFMHLLVRLALASWPYFFEAFTLSLTIDLAVGGAELIGGKVAVGLSRWSQ